MTIINIEAKDRETHVALWGSGSQRPAGVVETLTGWMVWWGGDRRVGEN